MKVIQFAFIAATIFAVASFTDASNPNASHQGPNTSRQGPYQRASSSEKGKKVVVEKVPVRRIVKRPAVDRSGATVWNDMDFGHAMG